MSIVAAPSFLRRVLQADAASCLACGALQLAALASLSSLTGLPQSLLLATGVFLVGYALVLAWVALRPQLPRRLVALFAAGNVGWAIGCGAALALWQPTAPGIAWIVLQGVTVLALAQLQWMGLRATRRLPGIAAA